MTNTTIFYILFSFLISVFAAYLFYYFKQKKQPKHTLLLFVLRSLSLFFLLVLLINPKIELKTYQNIKPKLMVLIDNSKSIKYFDETKNIENWIDFLKKNTEINNQFDVDFLSFDAQLKVTDSFDFNQPNTNIYEAIESVNNISKNKIAPILLLTDGNQTAGNSLDFVNSKQPIYPIVFGDTTLYQDIAIQQINVNKYSNLKNKFPVEILITYSGTKNEKSKITITSNNKVEYVETISFDKNKSSVFVKANLQSQTIGKQLYTVEIEALKDEKNTLNNRKTFGIEVLDEQNKTLLISSILHPDLGALKKAIESNQQKKVDIQLIGTELPNINDYQSFILYQPTILFKELLNRITKADAPFWIITGNATDWNFLSNSNLSLNKNSIKQKEEFTPIFNPNFQTFYQENIGFENFSPLSDAFGKITLNKEHQILLYQSLNGIETNQPLLATLASENTKQVYLFGEGIWKWRLQYFLIHSNFIGFDQFINTILQYASNTKKKKRLDLIYENTYPSNSKILFSAYYVDANYQFDPRATIELKIFDATNKEVKNVPFSIENNAYKVDIDNLSSGNYTFTATVANQNIIEKGSFTIEPYDIEQQFTAANVFELNKVATTSNGALFFKNDFEKIENELLTNKKFVTIQQENTSLKQLLDWKWLLFIICVFLAIEWFVRKYVGKI